jgi:hypothetical protein
MSGWIGIVRPLRLRCAKHLRMTDFGDAIIGIPHPEERAQPASRRRQDANAMGRR